MRCKKKDAMKNPMDFARHHRDGLDAAAAVRAPRGLDQLSERRTPPGPLPQ
jgi:hypothetical protein